MELSVFTEAANMPCTLDAIKQFYIIKFFMHRVKLLIQAVSASGLEMTQNSIRLNWSHEEVDARLKDIML